MATVSGSVTVVPLVTALTVSVAAPAGSPAGTATCNAAVSPSLTAAEPTSVPSIVATSLVSAGTPSEVSVSFENCRSNEAPAVTLPPAGMPVTATARRS